MRKNGAGAVPSPSAAVTDAMPSSISCWTRSTGKWCMPVGWFWVWVATVWPALRTLRTPSGLAWAWRPTRKKVAFTHWEARISRIWLLYFGSGPSSKVSTTSPSASGSVSEYCMVPMRGCSRGSTTRVREVPSASGWPGQSAAKGPEAAGAVRQANSPRPTAIRRRIPTNTLPVMQHRLIPRIPLQFGRELRSTGRRERGQLIARFCARTMRSDHDPIHSVTV